MTASWSLPKTLPPEARAFFTALLPTFTRPTATRFMTLMGAAILSTGRRTIENLQRTLGPVLHVIAPHINGFLTRSAWSTRRFPRRDELCRGRPKYSVSAEFVRRFYARYLATQEIAPRPPIPRVVPFHRRHEPFIRISN